MEQLPNNIYLSIIYLSICLSSFLYAFPCKEVFLEINKPHQYAICVSYISSVYIQTYITSWTNIENIYISWLLSLLFNSISLVTNQAFWEGFPHRYRVQFCWELYMKVLCSPLTMSGRWIHVWPWPLSLGTESWKERCKDQKQTSKTVNLFATVTTTWWDWNK